MNMNTRPFKAAMTNTSKGLSSAVNGNVVISPLESVHINLTNLKAFVDGVLTHLPIFDSTDDIVRKDFIKAMKNVLACAELLPDLLTKELSSMLLDPKTLLDIGDIQMKHLWEDLQIIYHFTMNSFAKIGEQDEKQKVLLGLPFLRFIFTKEGDPESMERIAKRMTEHAPSFLAHGRDRLKNGIQDAEIVNNDNPSNNNSNKSFSSLFSGPSI